MAESKVTAAQLLYCLYSSYTLLHDRCAALPCFRHGRYLILHQAGMCLGLCWPPGTTKSAAPYCSWS